MRNGWWFLIVGFGMIVSFASRADAPAGLSVAQAVREGLGESPTVKKMESAEEAADWGQTLGLSELVPHVDLYTEHFFAAQYPTLPVTLGGTTVVVPEVSPRTAYGASASWTLFDGLANIETYRASRKVHTAAEKERSREAFEVRKRIELAFANAIAARRFEEVATENLKTLDENLAQVRNRLAGGVATAYDVLRVEVQESDAVTDLERARDGVAIQRRNLAQAMGLRDDARELSGSLPVPGAVGPVQALNEPSLETREDFEAARLRSEAFDAQSAAARGRLLPAVGLLARYEKYENTDYPGEAYGGFREAWNVGVFLKWSILDGGATLARAGVARAHAAEAGHAYAEKVLSLPRDFELWKRRYIYSAHRFAAKQRDLKRSEESFRISNVSFQQGRKTITDVLEAETDLFRSRAGVVQAQLDAEEARVQLELTLGKDLTP